MDSSIIGTIRNCTANCITEVNLNASLDTVLVKLDNLWDLLQQLGNLEWKCAAQQLIENAITIVQQQLNDGCCLRLRAPGRPRIQIPTDTVEYLLSIKFKVTEIAKFFGVSKDTIFRRMKDSNISVKSTYTQITDNELQSKITSILCTFPNTGYKRMKGFLLDVGLKLTDLRVREAMRIADPTGVYIRTICNRAIVRRVYYVKYFNELWHLDTNMKLIRWNVVIRSCIDGKTRTVVYLDASGDNTAESNFVAFSKAVREYGVPMRTRSDKGGENVIIARFMIEQRGLNRGSHIYGRSVYNQRIERYWRDVFYGYTGSLYNLFSQLESDGHVNVDNPKHIALLHYVFLPRMNQNLETFRRGWNSHPLSSEGNHSPTQLMFMHIPPASYDHQLTLGELEDVEFICNNFNDVPILEEVDSITSPALVDHMLTSIERRALANIDVLRASQNMGYDIFLEAKECIGLI